MGPQKKILYYLHLYLTIADANMLDLRQARLL